MVLSQSAGQHDITPREGEVWLAEFTLAGINANNIRQPLDLSLLAGGAAGATAFVRADYGASAEIPGAGMSVTFVTDGTDGRLLCEMSTAQVLALYTYLSTEDTPDPGEENLAAAPSALWSLYLDFGNGPRLYLWGQVTIDRKIRD